MNRNRIKLLKIYTSRQNPNRQAVVFELGPDSLRATIGHSGKLGEGDDAMSITELEVLTIRITEFLREFE